MEYENDLLIGLGKDFKKKLNDLLNRRHDGSDLFVFCTDILGFRNVNMYYGTESGNELLRAVEKRLADDESILLSARFYSDHFVYVKQYPKDVSDETIAAEQQKNTSAFVREQQYKYPACRLNFPCGFTRAATTDVAAVIEEANFARKEAKRRGMGKCLSFQSISAPVFGNLKQVEEDINLALKNDGFCFFLQPKVDLTTGEIFGAEALARRLDKDGNVIYPDRFLSLMENNGSIVELDILICRQVCRYLARRRAEGKPVVCVSVNLSRLHTQRPETAELFHSIATEYGIPPSLLQFELTETIFLNDFSGAKELIDRLRAYGYTVAIDDFGSGYAGINIWREMNFDVLKLDKNFLSPAESVKERNEALLPNLINISQRLKNSVLCEGVETEEQCRYLLRLGCKRVQGFYFSRPVPADRFFATYEKQDGKYPVDFSARKKTEFAAPSRQARKDARRSDGKTPLTEFLRRRAAPAAALTLGVIVLALSVFFTFNFYRASTQAQFGEMATENVNARANEQRNAVRALISDNVNTLLALAPLFGNSPDRVNDYIELLSKETPDIRFQYSTDEQLRQNVGIRPQDAETVNRLRGGENVVSDVYFSPTLEEYCFAVGVPVFSASAAEGETADGENTETANEDGKVFVGCIRALIPASKLTAVSASPAVDGEVKRCLLTYSDGAIVYTDEESAAQTQTIFSLVGDEYMRRQLNALFEEFREASSPRASDTDGTVKGIRLGRDADSAKYVSVASVGYNDWNIVIFFSAEAAALRAGVIYRNAMSGTIILIAIVALVCAGFIALFVFVQKKLTAEEKRYLLLERFSDTVLFDYDKKRDIFRVTSNAEKLFRIHTYVQENFVKKLETSYIYAGDIPTVAALVKGECTQRDVRIRLLQPDRDNYFWCLIRFFYVRKKGAIVSIIGKISDIDDLKQREEELMEIASTDALTGLFNKNAVEEEISSRLKNDRSGALFMMDVDNFKQINDTYGHTRGDDTLRELSAALRTVFDEPGIVGRVGGDEMIAYLPHCRSQAEARNKAEELFALLENRKDGINLSLSVGVAFCPQDGESFGALYSEADKAMYEAKRSGKHRCAFASQYPPPPHET